MTEVQFWKPGEKRPRGEDRGASKSAGGRDNKRNKNKRRNKGRHGDTDQGGSTRRDGDGNLGERNGKKHHDKRSGKEEQPPAGVETRLPPPPVAPKAKSKARSKAMSKAEAKPPSSSLLALKFMQRKVKADEAHTEDRKPDRDFGFSNTKRLKTNKCNRDQLVCREDKQDPALVLVGRRSFGGFNTVVEAAYNACVKEIAAGQGVVQPCPTAEEEDGETSDLQMAETLGKHMRRGDARR